MARSHPHFKNGSFLLFLTAAIASCGGAETSATSGGGSTTSTSASGGSTSAGDGGTGGATQSGGTAGSGGTTMAGGAAGSGGTTMAGGAAGSGGTAGAGGTTTTTTTSSTIRRPFLVGGTMRSARMTERRDWSASIAAAPRAPRGATADLLAQSWLRDALEEHASIAAFARFTMQLLSLGAPPDLVVRAQRASLDEVRHAQACFALAERYGAGARGPAPLAVEDALGVWSLAEVATLTAQEGCVGETLGALLAQEQLARASDPEVIRILRRIAADEARHAELAWRFVRWAVLQGGAEVKRAVADAIESAAAATLGVETRSYDGIDIEALHAHGRVTCSEARAVAERGIREIVRPCAALALGGSPEGDGAVPRAIDLPRTL